MGQNPNFLPGFKTLLEDTNMVGHYLFEYESGIYLCLSSVKLDENNIAKHSIMECRTISKEYRQAHGDTPHAYLLAATENDDRVELATVVGFDFCRCSDEEFDEFLTALINKVDNDTLYPVESLADFVGFVKSNYPY